MCIRLRDLCRSLVPERQTPDLLGEAERQKALLPPPLRSGLLNQLQGQGDVASA